MENAVQTGKPRMRFDDVLPRCSMPEPDPVRGTVSRLRLLAVAGFIALSPAAGAAYGEEVLSGAAVITADRLADATWDAVGCGRPITWTWPDGAVGMTLTAVPDRGNAITVSISDRTVTEYALPVPEKAEDERRYDVTIVFRDAKGCAEVKSATVYSLTGLNGAATRVRIAARDWARTRHGWFVVPAFAGNDAAEVDATPLDGSFWRLAGLLETGSHAASLESSAGSYSYSQTLNVYDDATVLFLR